MATEKLEFTRPARSVGVVVEQGNAGTDTGDPEDMGVIAIDSYQRHSDGPSLWGTPADVWGKISRNSHKGGLIFFDRHTNREQIEAALELMGIRAHEKDFRIFKLSHERPKGNVITEWRIVSSFAMKHFYSGEAPEQEVDLLEALLAIMEDERKKHPDQSDDGITAISFGFLVENSYYGIARLWSRWTYYAK